MDPKVVAFIGIGLRIFTFICLLIALTVIGTDKLDLIDGYKATFIDVHGYRYVLSVAAIGLAHTIFQLGFSIYHALTQNIPFWNGLPQFNYYADQVGDHIITFFFVVVKFLQNLGLQVNQNWGETAGDNLGVGFGSWGWLCGLRGAEKINTFKH